LQRESSSCFLQDTRHVTRIIKFATSIVGYRRKEKIYVKGKRSISIWDRNIS
jgi:hypothetical protein